MLRLYLYARVRILKCILHTRPRVQQAPGVPCALSLLGRNDLVQPGQIMPRECGRVSARHCERSEAIHFTAQRKMDCFASLAMTVAGSPDERIRATGCLKIESGSTLAGLRNYFGCSLSAAELMQ